MTPHDIVRKLRSDLQYIAPEELYVKFCKASRALRAAEKIYDDGPRTDAAEEALEVLPELRQIYETLLVEINNQKEGSNG